MKNKLVPFIITSFFILIFTIFYKGLQETNIYTPKTKINDELPSISVELFFLNEVVNSSEVFELNTFYLLNIWSSWCVPCRQEHPELMGLTKNEKIKVIGINYKDSKKNANSFLNELGNPYEEIIFDKDGTQAIEWGAYGVPESFLIYNSKVIKRYIGPLNKKLIKEIKSVLNENI